MTGQDEGFAWVYPVFSYLIEPGPRPGFLQARNNDGSTIVMLPIWTDEELFATYLTRSGLAGSVSGLAMFKKPEVLAFLSLSTADCQIAVIDPPAGERPIIRSWPIPDLMAYIQQQPD